jgi:hypothetical protein
MPSRWLHDSLLSSQRWNDLGLAAQNLYIRLMLVVDDFGSFDGREAVIANCCYPTQRMDVSEHLAALQAADMIVRYSNAGKPYVAITRWQNDIRGKRRFPAPPICNEAPETLPNLRGKYGRDIGWRNPGGTAPTSLLLDAHMRPANPQPPEWRLVDKDFAPDPAGLQPLNTNGQQPLNTMVRKPYPLDVELELDVDPELDKTKTQTKTQTPPPAPQHGTQPLQATPPTPTNGKVALNDKGEWAGISEEQRVRWQGMFASLSVPDQIERAGAWLVAHPEERAIYTERDELEQYVIRWLLREARGTDPAKGAPDSQGKR